MQSIEIPATDWTRSLDAFSKHHDGWLVSLEIFSPASGLLREFRRMPLVGVTAESAGGRAISIAVAEATGGHLSHIVLAPKQVFLEKTDTGADAALEIVGGDGGRSILRLRTTRPDRQEGV